MYMNATVLRVNTGNLLVRDLKNHQEVLVHYRNTRGFSPGNHIRIEFNGQMTPSIPPQITAISIQVIRDPAPPPQSRPSEVRAIVLQRRRTSLLVRDMGNNRQLVVNTPHSHHFCIGQRIVVKHDRIIMNNPPEINAIDITTMC